MPQTVCIKTLGCKVNQAESGEIARALQTRGIALVDSYDHAAITLINTCSVTQRSDAKVRKEIRRALKPAQVEVVVVTGCSAVLAGAHLADIDVRVHVEPDKTRIPDWICAHLPAGGTDTRQVTLPRSLDRTRVNLKITDGCENFCSFCIVPFARGATSSIPHGEVIDRIAELVSSGVREIVLTGIDVGSYRDGTLDLAGLIRLIGERTALHRLRISSIEPQTITDEFISLFTESDLLCEHLHIPLQSGSDAVLAAMRRRYTTAQYRNLIGRLRDAVPTIAIHTDLIVGYPTETAHDFEQGLQFVREMQFAGTHLFKFSARPGTEAAALPPLDPSTIDERFTRLAADARQSARHYRTARLSSGDELELIIERIDETHLSATSREHIAFSWELSDVPFRDARIGAIVTYREKGHE